MRKLTLMITLLLLVGLNPNSANAAGSITSVSIEKRTAVVGDTVYWNIEASCGINQINQIYMLITDPTGLGQTINSPGLNGKQETNKITKGSFRLPLKITSEANPGEYKVSSVNLSCMNQNESTAWSSNLESLSFTLTNDGLTPATTQPKLEKIELITPSERKVGDTISIHLIASNTGKINTIWVFLRNQNGIDVFKMFNNYNANNSGPSTRRVDMNFDFEVGQDWPAGVWSISRVEISGYAGIDLMTPWGFDLNPTNSTAVFNRMVTIQNLASEKLSGQSVSGQPANGGVTQADITSIKINVSNDLAAAIAAPEVSNLMMPITEIKAGESFDMTLDIDGKNAYIYQIFGNWADKETYNKSGASCYVKNLNTAEFVKTMKNVVLSCKTSRGSTPGSYIMRQLSVYTTSCSGSIKDFGLPVNQDCQQSPKQRHTDYENAYGSARVSAYPDSKNKLTNPLLQLPLLKILPAGPLTRPILEAVSTTESKIIFKYPFDYDLTCDFSPSAGSIKYDGIKGDGSVTISGLNPVSSVILSGTCKSIDGQTISFSDQAKTTLPLPPSLPLPTNKKSELNSISVVFNELDTSQFQYEVSATDGSVLVLANTVVISDLAPNRTIDISMKITDKFGQVTQGKVTTVTTQSLPTLNPPGVTLLKSGKGIYLFEFSKSEKFTYEVKALNCSAKIVGNQIQVSGLLKKKMASVVLSVRDQFGQTNSTKFFQFTGK